MAEYKKTGSGMTASTRVTYNEVDDPQYFENARNEHTFTLADDLETQEQYCAQTLRKLGLPDHLGLFVRTDCGWKDAIGSESDRANGHMLWTIVLELEKHDHDSEAGYATQLLMWISFLRQAIAEGDMEHAVKLAWQIGDLTCEWEMKNRFDRHATRGLRVGAAGKENLSHVNRQRQQAAKLEWQRVCAEAETRRKGSGTKLTDRNLAGHLKRDLSLNFSIDTIRKRIAKKLARPA